MTTTIQISDEMKAKLDKLKLYARETYEEIIWNLIEDQMELSAETKKNIEESEKDIEAGRTITLEELKKKRGL